MIKSAAMMVICSLFLALGACQSTQTRYAAFGNAPASDQLALIESSKVWYDLSDEFYHIQPECVMILPHESHDAKHIEQVIARHASAHFSKIIHADRVQHYMQKNALDATKTDHIRLLRQGLRCDTLLSWQHWHHQDQDLGFWTKRRAGLHLTLEHHYMNHKTTLWQAKHAASRSQGALPLSPIGAIAGIAKAADFRASHDVGHSLIDDALRRIFITLPYG